MAIHRCPEPWLLLNLCTLLYKKTGLAAAVTVCPVSAMLVVVSSYNWKKEKDKNKKRECKQKQSNLCVSNVRCYKRANALSWKVVDI